MNKQGNTTKIRAAVAVSVTGGWQVAGWSRTGTIETPGYDKNMRDCCLDTLEGELSHVVFIEAEIPNPRPVQAEIGPQYRCGKCGQRFFSMPHAHMNRRDTDSCDGHVSSMAEGYDQQQDEKAMESTP